MKKALLLILSVFFCREAYTGTYGSYFKGFKGFAADVPIEVGYMSDHDEESRIYQQRQDQAAKALDENLPLLKKMITHFQTGNHPFTEFKDAIASDHVPTEQEYDKNAGISLSSDRFTLRLPLKPNLPEYARVALADQFVFAQFFGNGPGLGSTAIKDSNLEEYVGSYCWGNGHAYPILRALVHKSEEIKKQEDSGDPCTKITIRLLSAMLKGSKPETNLLDEIWPLEKNLRQSFLLRSADAFPKYHQALAKEWVDRIRDLVEKDSENPSLFAENQLLLIQFASRLNVSPGQFTGKEWIKKLQASSYPDKDLNLYFQWVRSSMVPIQSTKQIVHEAFRKSKNPDLVGTVELSLREAQAEIPDADEIASDLIDAPLRKGDFYYTALAVLNTKSPLKDRAATIIRILKKGKVRELGNELEKSPKGHEVFDKILENSMEVPKNLIEMLYLTNKEVLSKHPNVGSAIVRAIQSPGLDPQDLVYVRKITSDKDLPKAQTKAILAAIASSPVAVKR